MSWQKLDELCHKLESLEHAKAMLSADEATQMPAGGGAKRAEAVAFISGLYHEMASAPEIADWIHAARSQTETDDQVAALAEFERAYRDRTCLPAEFVRRKTEADMRSEQLWRELRPTSDWNTFRPALEGVIELAREEAAMRSAAGGLDPYDALIDQFDPGSRADQIAPVFATLKAFLKDFLPRVIDAQERRLAKRPLKALAGPYPVEGQRRLGLALMRAVGFDFEHGRLDTSHHPFCGGVPTDVRMTTRYREDDFLVALMGVLHETGHALYEQNLPKDWSHWPLGQARGMSIHESQSLFMEMQVARMPEFWEWAMPQVHEHLGQTVEGWTGADVLAHVNHVQAGFIRVDADEVTYPLHVILRFELEQELISGRLQVADIPEAWDAKMREYLGLGTLDNPRDGPMQDVHWPVGLFGYFPSYTLGALTAAQQWWALEREMPDIREDVRAGRFDRLIDWRKANIWSQGSRYSTPDLVVRSTGKPLDPEIFVAHLTQRYLG
ncbi:MAG TPA: carboxypeptidase M32 [Devosiaceae bacterium]